METDTLSFGGKPRREQRASQGLYSALKKAILAD
jgi:hypothetical protein